MVAGRDLATLPKAHLHLHFTGSLSVPTLVGLADARGIDLPEQLVDSIALDVPADKRGWYRFQRFYDIARAAVQGEDALRTVVRSAAAEDAAEGSRRLELQVDPTSYAASVGGLQPALEIICDEARSASAGMAWARCLAGTCPLRSTARPTQSIIVSAVVIIHTDTDPRSPCACV